MSYDTKIGEAQSTPWAELYTFSVGTKVNYYTSYSEDFTYLGQVYKKASIERSNFSQDSELTSDRIKVTAPLDEIMLSFVANAPVEPVKVKIVRVFDDASEDAATIFNGEVIGVTLKSNVATADCESDTGIFRNDFPNFTYQSTCQWMLFDGGCQLSEALFQVSAVVTINGSKLVSASFATKPDGWFQGGHVRFQNDIRLITAHTGNEITLQVPFDARLKDGNTVSAFPGCDKTRATCLSKFNNLARFTGFVNIPENNPTITGVK